MTLEASGTLVANANHQYLCTILMFLHIIALYYTRLVIYILDGGKCALPPLSAVVAPSCYLSGLFCVSGYYPVFLCRSLCRLGLYAMGWIMGWCRVRTLSGLRIFQHP